METQWFCHRELKPGAWDTTVRGQVPIPEFPFQSSHSKSNMCLWLPALESLLCSVLWPQRSLLEGESRLFPLSQTVSEAEEKFYFLLCSLWFSLWVTSLSAAEEARGFTLADGVSCWQYITLKIPFNILLRHAIKEEWISRIIKICLICMELRALFWHQTSLSAICGISTAKCFIYVKISLSVQRMKNLWLFHILINAVLCINLDFWNNFDSDKGILHRLSAAACRVSHVLRNYAAEC